MEHKKGDVVSFDWRVHPEKDSVRLQGEVVGFEGDNYLIVVVDAARRVHTFHVVPDDVVTE